MTDRDRDLFGTALSCLLGDYPGFCRMWRLIYADPAGRLRNRFSASNRFSFRV